MLQIKAMGIDNIMNFEWISPPLPNMIKALELLYALRALDDDAKLTNPLGIHLAELPVEPQLGKMLLVSGEMGCVRGAHGGGVYAGAFAVGDAPRSKETFR